MITSERKIIFLSIAITLFLATGLSYSDYGWGDSGPFTGYFLSFPQEGSFGWGDSDGFPVWLLSVPKSGATGWRDADLTLNLLNINRTWADSDSFSFDWLANSQPSTGPPMQPLPFDCNDLLEQYDSENNRWISPVVSCPSAGQPVIVLNHGWNSSTETLLPLAQAISNRIPGIHIYAWHWGEGENTESDANPNGMSTVADFTDWSDCFTSTNDAKKCLIGDFPLKNELLKSMTNAANNGDRLGDSLLAHGIRPNLYKIHLIGSSYGGVVCAVAAKALKKCGVPVQQLTTIDTPDVLVNAVNTYIDPSSAERVEVLYYNWKGIAWVDAPTPTLTLALAMGATGGPLNSAAPNLLNIKLNPWYYRSLADFPLHFRAGDWYEESINLSALNCEDDPYGFGWSVSLNPTGWQWNNWPLGNEDETMGGKGCLTPVPELFVKEVTKAADKVKDDFSSAASYVGQKASLVVDGVKDSVSAVLLYLQGVWPQSQGKYFAFSGMDSPSDLNDAYIYKEVNIPAGTDQVALDVRFSTVGEGDKLTLSVGDEILIVVDACAVGVSDTYQTYYAYVGNYAGQTTTIQIALRPSGTGQSVALVDNLRFTTLTLVEDITGDKVIDEVDLSVLAENWLVVGCDFREHCKGADIDRDNKVDFIDFSRLATYWLESF
ncbi:MAG: dockerin type I domain-containing protein [Planctomycetota bacterium]